MQALEFSSAGPLVYPVSKAVRLAKAPPSLERTVDTEALTLGPDAMLRRVRQQAAQRRAVRAAEAIRSYR